MKEIWKDIEGYEGIYQVSNLGRIKALKKIVRWDGGKDYPREEYIMKNVLTAKGYEQITLSKNSTQVRRMVHHLVADAFIEPDLSRPHINHKNGIKNDNRLDNLERCTVQENNIHKFRVLGHRSPALGKFGKHSPKHNRVKQLSLDGKLIKLWDCASDAVREGGFDSGCISRTAHGQQTSHKGFRWEYV